MHPPKKRGWEGGDRLAEIKNWNSIGIKPRVVGEGREVSCLCTCHAWVGVEGEERSGVGGWMVA